VKELEGMKDVEKALHAVHGLIASVEYDQKPMSRIDDNTSVLQSKVQYR
jgi:hypothetical protein